MEHTIKTEFFRYQCKYCLVIYEDRDKFIQHKKQDHLPEVLRDLKKKSNNVQFEDKEVQILEIPEVNTTMTIKKTDVKPIYTTTETVMQILDMDDTNNSNPGLTTSSTQTTEFASTGTSMSDMDRSDNVNPGLKTSSTQTLESTNNGSKMFSCPKCPFTTLNRNRLELHFNNHVLKTSLPCPICSIQFANSFGVKIHVSRSHSTKSPGNKAKLEEFFQQNPITKSADDKIVPKSGKVKHKLRIPGGYPCRHCNRTYDLDSVRNAHETHHTKPIKCPLCNKGTPNNAHLLYHFKRKHQGHVLNTNSIKHIYKPRKHWNDLEGQQTHEGLKRKCAAEVDKINQNHNVQHQSSLSFAIKPFTLTIEKLKVKYCIKPPKNLNEFKCNICTKSFLTRKRLTDHKFNHKKTKECPYCNKRYPFNSYLKRHIKSNHLNQNLVPQCQSTTTELKNASQLLKCSFCPKSFSSQQGLVCHKMYHNKRKQCPYCNLKFSFNMISRHIKIKHNNPLLLQ